jgi:hypothetical protein
MECSWSADILSARARSANIIVRRRSQKDLRVLRPLADRMFALHFKEIQSAVKVGALQNLQVAAPFPLTYNLDAVSIPELREQIDAISKA